MMAAQLSARLGMIADADVERVRKIHVRAGLPVTGPVLGPDRYVELMRHDKKVENGRLRLILLKAVGQAIIHDTAPLSDIEAAIVDCCA